MALKVSIFGLIALISAMAVPTARGPKAQPAGAAWLLSCPVDQRTMVRFFFNPEGADYFHTALVFQVVSANDPRLNTGPLTREGRTTYITREEMKAMLRALAQSGASWSVSSKVTPLGNAHSLLRLYGFYLHIQVVCSKGTARGRVEPQQICSTLAPLDSALKTPRALWEFQALQTGYRCKVPGFSWDAYPKRRP